MKSLFETLQNYKLKRQGDPITDLIQEFQIEINKERLGTKYKPLTFVAVRKKLAHLKEEDLRTFLSMCRDYKNRKGIFSKYFFGALKIK